MLFFRFLLLLLFFQFDICYSGVRWCYNGLHVNASKAFILATIGFVAMISIIKWFLKKPPLNLDTVSLGNNFNALPNDIKRNILNLAFESPLAYINTIARIDRAHNQYLERTVSEFARKGGNKEYILRDLLEYSHANIIFDLSMIIREWGFDYQTVPCSDESKKQLARVGKLIRHLHRLSGQSVNEIAEENRLSNYRLYHDWFVFGSLVYNCYRPEDPEFFLSLTCKEYLDTFIELDYILSFEFTTASYKDTILNAIKGSTLSNKSQLETLLNDNSYTGGMFNRYRRLNNHCLIHSPFNLFLSHFNSEVILFWLDYIKTDPKSRYAGGALVKNKRLEFNWIAKQGCTVHDLIYATAMSYDPKSKYKLWPQVAEMLNDKGLCTPDKQLRYL